MYIYRYVISLSLLAFLVIVPLAAFEGSYTLSRRSKQVYLLEGKVSAFRPESEILRKIYGEYWPNYQLEGSVLFNKNARIWLSANYLSRTGQSIGNQDETSIQLIPVTLGIDYIWIFNHTFEFYAGGGARYFLLHIKNHSPHVHSTNTKGGLGGAVRLGVLANLSKCFVIDLFVDYGIKTLPFRNSERSLRHDLDVSGLSLGGGLGYRF